MTFREVYDAQVRFVWRALFRLGVHESDLSDAVQDVFVVVHRKLPEFEGHSKITTWLFGICIRVTSDRRKSAHARRELLAGEVHASAAGDQDTCLDRRRARELLDGILERMPEDQRIVFTLFEFEGMTGDEIAELLDVPVGTVRSRLRLAREAFQQAISRLRLRERTMASPVFASRGT